MTVFLNGEFVPEERATVSVFDRSFRYGDGLFEAVLVHNGAFFRWVQHYERLRRSAEFLRIPLPYGSNDLHAAAVQVARRNGITNGIVRVALSRGTGRHGYAPSADEAPVVAVWTQTIPRRHAEPWKLAVSSFRIAAGDRLAQHKTANRLLNVMAAMEARERGADEALLLDTENHVAEGGSSNVFWIANGLVSTTPVSAGVLAGITRAAIFEICAALKCPVREQRATLPALLSSEGVFISVTSRGVVEIGEIDGAPVARSKLTSELSRGLWNLIEQECE